MKTRLLAAVQSERQRALAPAVVEVGRLRFERAGQNTSLAKRTLARVKAALGVVYRTYCFANDVASFSNEAVVLPAKGHKYDEVYGELTQAGLSPCRIGTGPRGEGRLYRVIGRGKSVYAVLRALLVTMRAWRSVRLRPYVEVLILTEALVPLLAGKKHRQHWVVIGDLTTALIALASACQSTGHKVITWQYSYLDFKRFPVRGNAAVILNDEGRALARRGSAVEGDDGVYWRPSLEIEPLRMERLADGLVGAFLNVHAHDAAIERLSNLQRVLERPIHVRLHPNSSLSNSNWTDGLVLADPREPLEEFAARIALAICGNTQAQAKALSLGTPVVQCAGLDILPFDHHGYIRDGILPGIKTVAEFSIDRIQVFYQDSSYRSALRCHMGPSPEARQPDLEKLVRDLAKNADEVSRYQSTQSTAWNHGVK